MGGQVWAGASPAWLMRVASASSKQLCDVREVEIVWIGARVGRRDGVGSNEYGLGSGVNAGRRVGSRWKSGREAFASREAEMRRDLTSRRGDVGMLASVALAKLALHLVLSGRYGYWRRGPPFRVTTACPIG